jgi:hypothetical protein
VANPKRPLRRKREISGRVLFMPVGILLVGFGLISFVLPILLACTALGLFSIYWGIRSDREQNHRR